VTPDPRLRVGGWAALLTAVLVPIEFVVLFAAARDPDPLGTPAFVVVETLRIVAALVAMVGLDRLFRSISPGAAPVVLVVGCAGGVIGILGGAAALVGIDTAALDIPIVLTTNVLVGAWFIGGGAILMRSGGGLARIGWTAELGGLGMILSGLAIAIPFAGPIGVTGTSLNDWYRILGLFVIVYLVRIWRYVVGGRLPGPGIL
jgi:hypothetical protein